MASKFNEFLTAQKIDPRRLMAASRKIERLRPEDRTVRLARRLAQADESGSADKKTFPKSRSGRPLTERQISLAMGGKALPASVKTRCLRAVNAVLEQKKAKPVSLQSLF